MIRDNAFIISPELRFPVYKDRYGKALVYLIPFVDYGIGWNSNGPGAGGDLQRGTGRDVQPDRSHQHVAVLGPRV